MKRIPHLVLAPLLVLSACSSETSTTPSPAPAKPAETPAAKPAETPKPPPAEPAANAPAAPVESPKPAATANMDADIATLMAKPEQPDASITIQHILIAFRDAPGMSSRAPRSKDEAKALAEKVYAEVVAGGDFDALVKQYTNDSPPGIYPLDQASRKGMVRSFGDVGWRLKVGEVGVAPWDKAASPYGWHIIKRLQ